MLFSDVTGLFGGDSEVPTPVMSEMFMIFEGSRFVLHLNFRV
jgi:hypothetical protein